jgi:hypothetical protein
MYQGLDVMIFSTLKWAWSDEQDHFEHNGSQVNKSNFIGVFAKAHACAFTPKNIKLAFTKTGIIPYNPNVITAEMMAPNLETLQKSTLPLPLASPIRELASLIANHQMCKHTANKMEHPGKQPEAPAGEYSPV